MKNELKRRYGAFTAIAMVVGIVIGSGVFFKAEAIQKAVGGNLQTGVAAWLFGGGIMIICTCMFSVISAKCGGEGGIVGYAKWALGTKYAYFVGWFMAAVYYPTLTSVLAWLSAKYTLAVFGVSDASGGLCLSLACLLLISACAVNVLSPAFAGKIQISLTAVKLIPLVLMAVFGTIYGASHGIIAENMRFAAQTETAATGLFGAVVATAFAYEGWIIATSINSELKNPKRDLPLALIVGSCIVIAVYLTYYIGIAGAARASEITSPEKGTLHAFEQVFGSVGASALTAFIAASCIGTLNGIMLGCTRAVYFVAETNNGPAPHIFSQLDSETNMPVNSAVLGLFLCGVWLFYFYGANLQNPPVFGIFSFDSSELPIVTLYALYLPIFVSYMIKGRNERVFKRYVLPVLAVISALAMIFAAVYAHGIVPYTAAKAAGGFSLPVLFYLIVFACIEALGALFYKNRG